MTVAENKAVVQRYMREAWDEGSETAVEELLAPGFRSLNAPPGSAGDRPAEAQLIKGFRDAFGSFESTFEDQIGEGDLVVSRWSATGTHQAPFFGVPATNQVVSMRGTELATVTDGRIESIFAIFDMVGLLQQLGAVPGGAPPPSRTQERVDGAVPTSEAEAKALVGRLAEEFWNVHDGAILDEIVHPRATYPSEPMLPTGPQGLRELGVAILAAFPDLHTSVEQVVGEADRATALCLNTGTHEGDFFGLSPTGRTVRWAEFTTVRVADGMIAELWLQTDRAALMQQLSPAPASAGTS